MLAVDLTASLALVTGASGELGRAMVRTLAAAGADVAIHYHRQETRAAALADEVRAMGRRAMMVQADVADGASVGRMAGLVGEALGMPDIVVANAAIQIDPWQDVLDEAPADYLSQFASCVMQSVYLAKAFVPAMQARRWGRYIAINTECAMEAAAGSSAYVAAKRGLDGIVRTLAREVGGGGVTVKQVAPGDTLSDRDREAGSAADAPAAYVRTVPLGRRGTDQEVANVVAFLASDLASFITGAYVPVCGGRVMPAI
jgi:3-oxoacyl-[acyl-carrier protein] reductase